MLVGRSPRLYARGTLEALERKRLVLHPPPAEKRERNAAPTSICPGARGRPTQLTLVTPLRRLAETRQSVKKAARHLRRYRSPRPRLPLTKPSWRMSAGSRFSEHIRARALRNKVHSAR
jgi:hypothetical protein